MTLEIPIGKGGYCRGLLGFSPSAGSSDSGESSAASTGPVSNECQAGNTIGFCQSTSVSEKESQTFLQIFHKV